MPAPTPARRTQSASDSPRDPLPAERIPNLRRGYTHRQISFDAGLAEIAKLKELAQQYQLPVAAVVRLIIRKALGIVPPDDPVGPDEITQMRSLGPRRRRTGGGRP